MSNESKKEIGIGWMKLVFHIIMFRKLPDEGYKLNKYANGMELTYVQFLKNMFGIKSGQWLEMKFKELRDPNTSIKSIRTECKKEDKTFRGLCWYHREQEGLHIIKHQ